MASYLRRDRAAEIAHSIASGQVFPCHQTVEYDDDDGEGEITEASQFCAGALIVMEHEDAPNQHVRIAERLGVYDPAKLDLEAPVHRSFVEFVQHHGADEDDEDDSCCSVCDPGCEAPAGYLVGGCVIPAERTGEVFYCDECGQPVCENCASGAVCSYCAESVTSA